MQQCVAVGSSAWPRLETAMLNLQQCRMCCSTCRVMYRQHSMYRQSCLQSCLQWQYSRVHSPPTYTMCTHSLHATMLWFGGCCCCLQAMERIHAIKADGTIVKDVEVFRELYEAVGLGWVYAITKNPSVLNAANAVYGVWAKYRTQITGREALEVILARRAAEEAAGGAVAGSLCRTADGSTAAACEVPQTVKQQS